jgi:hypothetical protein
MPARDARPLLSRVISLSGNPIALAVVHCSEHERDLFFTAWNLELLNIEPRIGSGASFEHRAKRVDVIDAFV